MDNETDNTYMPNLLRSNKSMCKICVRERYGDFVVVSSKVIRLFGIGINRTRTSSDSENFPAGYSC